MDVALSAGDPERGRRDGFGPHPVPMTRRVILGPAMITIDKK